LEQADRETYIAGGDPLVVRPQRVAWQLKMPAERYHLGSILRQSRAVTEDARLIWNQFNQALEEQFYRALLRVGAGPAWRQVLRQSAAHADAQHRMFLATLEFVDAQLLELRPGFLGLTQIRVGLPLFLLVLLVAA